MRVCDHCGNFDLVVHCTSPVCPWLKCTRTACGGFGRPGSMLLPLSTAKPKETDT